MLQVVKLSAQYFGEGMTILNDEVSAQEGMLSGNRRSRREGLLALVGRELGSCGLKALSAPQEGADARSRAVAEGWIRSRVNPSSLS